MIHKYSLSLTAIALILSACQTTGTEHAPVSPRPISTDKASPDATLPLDTFVQASCASCHAVEVGTLSPNPLAPTFEDVANRQAVTRETLRVYLLDAHNYPVEMDFELTSERVDAVVDYILDLRSENYKRSGG